MDTALGFPGSWKTLGHACRWCVLFQTSCDLFALCAMDTLVSHLAFPTRTKSFLQPVILTDAPSVRWSAGKHPAFPLCFMLSQWTGLSTRTTRGSAHGAGQHNGLDYTTTPLVRLCLRPATSHSIKASGTRGWLTCGPTHLKGRRFNQNHWLKKTLSACWESQVAYRYKAYPGPRAKQVELVLTRTPYLQALPEFRFFPSFQKPAQCPRDSPSKWHAPYYEVPADHRPQVWVQGVWIVCVATEGVRLQTRRRDMERIKKHP